MICPGCHKTLPDSSVRDSIVSGTCPHCGEVFYAVFDSDGDGRFCTTWTERQQRGLRAAFSPLLECRRVLLVHPGEIGSEGFSVLTLMAVGRGEGIVIPAGAFSIEDSLRRLFRVVAVPESYFLVSSSFVRQTLVKVLQPATRGVELFCLSHPDDSFKKL